jgi:hypothetical protein
LEEAIFENADGSTSTDINLQKTCFPQGKEDVIGSTSGLEGISGLR